MAEKGTRQRSRQRTQFKTIISLVILLVLIAAALLITFGESLGFPGWNGLFSAAGLADESDSPLQVHFLDTGQSDCVLIQVDGKNILIDAGLSSSYDKIDSFLKKHRAEVLDLVVATHYHSDHIGSMSKIIDNYAIKEFLMNDLSEENTPTTATYEKMLLSLEKKANIKVTAAKEEMAYSFGGAALKVLSALDKEGNDGSIVVKLTYDRYSFLFTGDADAIANQWLLDANIALKSNVFKVNHHGARTSGEKLYLEKISPEIAVFTVGEKNSYGHPSPEVLEILESMGADIYRTDKNGTVTVYLDNDKLLVKTEK